MFLVMFLIKNPLTILIMIAVKKPLLLSQVKVTRNINGSKTRKGQGGPQGRMISNVARNLITILV